MSTTMKILSDKAIIWQSAFDGLDIDIFLVSLSSKLTSFAA